MAEAGCEIELIIVLWPNHRRNGGFQAVVRDAGAPMMDHGSELNDELLVVEISVHAPVFSLGPCHGFVPTGGVVKEQVGHFTCPHLQVLRQEVACVRQVRTNRHQDVAVCRPRRFTTGWLNPAFGSTLEGFGGQDRTLPETIF